LFWSVPQSVLQSVLQSASHELLSRPAVQKLHTVQKALGQIELLQWHIPGPGHGHWMVPPQPLGVMPQSVAVQTGFGVHAVVVVVEAVVVVEVVVVGVRHPAPAHAVHAVASQAE
jgi:hypothetical protein